MLERFRCPPLRGVDPKPQQLQSELVCAGVLERAWLCSWVASNGVLNGSKTHIRHDLIIYPVLFRCTLGDTHNRIKRD